MQVGFFAGQDDDTTVVKIEHRGWERLGDRAHCVEGSQPGGLGVAAPYLARSSIVGDRHGAGPPPEERKGHGYVSEDSGTKDDPWTLTTPPGTSTYTMYRDETADPPALVCQVGSTALRYRLQAIDDLHTWLLDQGDWVPLGAADENKDAAAGTVEAWGRSPHNPVGGWYGLRKGYRGRFAMYLPPLLERLGLAEVTHESRNNRMRAITP